MVYSLCLGVHNVPALCCFRQAQVPLQLIRCVLNCDVRGSMCLGVYSLAALHSSSVRWRHDDNSSGCSGCSGTHSDRWCLRLSAFRGLQRPSPPLFLAFLLSAVTVHDGDITITTADAAVQGSTSLRSMRPWVRISYRRPCCLCLRSLESRVCCRLRLSLGLVLASSGTTDNN